MQKNYLGLTGIWRCIPILPVLICLLILSSCSSKPQFADTDCVVLTYAEVDKAWSGYISEADSVVFYPGNMGPAGLSVAAFVAKGDGTPISASGITAQKGENCKTQLDDTVYYNVNRAKFSDLKITKAGGGFEKFDYIKLVPKACDVGTGKYICFDVYVVDGTGEHLRVATKPDPCPPLCPDYPVPPPPPQE